MERIVYRKTLDVHKNGIQFMLQGFETADNLSRVIEISLMASGDAIDFPLERIVAMMYVTTPGAKEPSINECTVRDNKIVYDVLPIVEEGITIMQLKLIEVNTEGAKRVLASPKFSVEVIKSYTDDEGAEQSVTFTALENAMAKAKAVYDERFLRMELAADCMFKAYYADGSTYETDLLKKLFCKGDILIAESFAKGGTGIRAGEDTDNAKYYSNVSRSEALNAKSIMEDSNEILEEVKLHGVYTAFSVDFETGIAEYVSPSFKFMVNTETGELEAEGQTYGFDDEIARVVDEWLEENGVVLSDLQEISNSHDEEISNLQKTVTEHEADLVELNEKVLPIEKGGTNISSSRVDELITKLEDGVITEKEYNDELKALARESIGFENISIASVLSKGKWIKGEYSFESQYPSATYDIDLCLQGDTLTETQRQAYTDAEIVGCNSENKIKAFGTVPAVDIPIILKAVKR